MAYYKMQRRLANVMWPRLESPRRDRWAVILAGGDGTRLRSLTRAIAGDDRPKQFCPILGSEADRPEVEYGWIEPATPILGQLPRAIRRVQRFWEKPSANLAKSLMKQGFFWNSFVMVGRVDAFLRMIERAVPNLYEAFAA